MTPDSSPENVAREVDWLLPTHPGTADMLETLAAERDVLAARVAELENAAILSKAAYEGVGSLLLSVQQDCIKEHNRAEAAETKLAASEAREAKLREALADAAGALDSAGEELSEFANVLSRALTQED